MARDYQKQKGSKRAKNTVVTPADRAALRQFLEQEGKLLLPILELIEKSSLAVDGVIDTVGRATIEALLTLSAQTVAGPKQRGVVRGDDDGIVWFGRQTGVVPMSDRNIRVNKPRLRRKGGGHDAEVAIPAYEAMQASTAVGQRILEILMHGVSTRSYREVLPDVAATVGISKSSVSREFIEASERALQELAERRFEDKDILIVYIDGIVFGAHHIIVAIGVDVDGCKHILGLREGASENGTVCTALLEDLVARGLSPDRRRLFVIDGSKALRSAIGAVFGDANPVQRCRNHKRKNVLDHLPEELKETAKATMNAAYRLDTKDGMARLESLARTVEDMHPDAAGSLREGLSETFTVNRLGLPATLRRCLCTTNVIESPNAGIRKRTGRVSRWRDGAMVKRWVATALIDAEKAFRKIMGHDQLWMLKSCLDERPDKTIVQQKDVA